MIKAIIFDLGGVVVDMESFLTKILEILKPADRDQFWQELNLNAIPLCKGEMTTRQFCEGLAKKYNKEEMTADLLKVWVDGYEKLVSVNQQVLDLVEKLRGKYKVAMVSNTNDEHTKVNRRLGIFKGFDVVVLSNEVKLTKDEKEIFLLAAKKLTVKPEECLFIDDIEKFVKVAESVGMKSILYKNPGELKESLKVFSVVID